MILRCCAPFMFASEETSISVMNGDILRIFTSFQDFIKEEQRVRDEIGTIVKQLETSSHEAVTALQIIHQDGSETSIKSCCDKAREIIEKGLKSQYKALNDLLQKLPTNQYYKYHDHWKFVTQQNVFVISLIVFLESGSLVSQEGAAEIMGVLPDRGAGFHLDLVDYLIGILQLASELSRFAVTSVTYGDLKRPVQISKFATELKSGFTLLNLKNDYLRKRFDCLKYDIKKIEEVVYDLHIRGLIKKE